MTLPVGQLAKSTYELHGESIPIHSLTRKQQFEVAAVKDDPEACEILILMYGTDSTREQTEEFQRTEGDADGVTGLVKAISRISGITIEDSEEEKQNGSVPKEALKRSTSVSS